MRGGTSGFQGVSSDQLRLLVLQDRSNTAQRLHQQFLLLRRLQHGQGHDRLGAVDLCTAGPEIGAGMEGGESTVQPGVADQRRKPIHALQQRRIALDACRILRWPAEPGLVQGGFEGLGRQLGCAPPAGHRF